MSGHDHLRTGIDSFPERNQLAFSKFLQSFVYTGQSHMTVCICITMTGEMFQAGDRAAFRQAFQKGSAVLRHSPGIIGKRAHTDDRVLWITVDIHHRGKVRVEAYEGQFLSYGSPGSSGQIRIPGCRERHISRPARGLRQAVDNSPFLIHRDQQGYSAFPVCILIRRLQITDQAHSVAQASGTVLTKKDHASEAALRDRLAHRFIHPGKGNCSFILMIRIVIPGPESRDQHLTDLFPERHFFHHGVHFRRCIVSLFL